MADGQTTNYQFVLPEVDGSDDTWGDKLNQNWTEADGVLNTLDQGLNGLSQDITSVEQDVSTLQGRSLTAGNGLTGGGTLAADRTFTLGTPGTLNGGTSNAVTASSHTHSITSTSSRTNGSNTTLLAAAAMNSHRTSGDHDSRYARLAGGSAANFTVMPQVAGDPIVESGSNTDGEWTRWADGTQVCSFIDGGASTSINTSGQVYMTNAIAWNYPAVFVAAPVVSPAFPRWDGAIVGHWASLSSQPSASSASIRGITTISRAKGVFVATATGRWK